MKKRKILSLLLVALMCIGMLPTTTFAGVSGYPPLPSVGIARDELASGTYYLYQDKKLIKDGANSDNYQIYYYENEDKTSSKLILKDVALEEYVLVRGGTTIEIYGEVSITGGVGIQSTSDGDVTLIGKGTPIEEGSTEEENQIQKSVLTINSDTEGILIDSPYAGNVNLTGDLIINMNCKAFAINNCEKLEDADEELETDNDFVKRNNIYISDNVELTSTGSQPVLGCRKSDIVISDNVKIKASGSIETNYGDIIIQDDAQVTVDTEDLSL